MALWELVERCERASWPDRELDADIWDALGLSPAYDGRRAAVFGKWARLDGGTYHLSDDSAWGVNCGAPAYTSSLDAAMALVPEGLHFEVTTTGFKPGATVCGDSLSVVHEGAYAATPALALTAAALRARAQQESQP